MATITIKGLPPTVHEALKARAKAHRRSLNQEVIASLERAVLARPVDVEEILDRARAVREKMSVYLTQKDLDTFKRIGRR